MTFLEASNYLAVHHNIKVRPEIVRRWWNRYLISGDDLTEEAIDNAVKNHKLPKRRRIIPSMPDSLSVEIIGEIFGSGVVEKLFGKDARK